MKMGQQNREAGAGQIYSPDVACYHAAHNFKGGVPALAALMEVNHRTLQNKLNPTQDTHKLTLAEAMHILRLTRDYKILDAVVHEVDCVWLERAMIDEPAGDVDLLKMITDLSGATHELSQGLVQSLEDGSVSHDEHLKLEALLHRLVQAAYMIPAVAAQFKE